jgi:hypothetical protein
MYTSETTKISETGLRYTTKESGSPYRDIGGSGETMSCIKCGQHRARRLGIFKRYATALMFFCFDCKPRAASA